MVSFYLECGACGHQVGRLESWISGQHSCPGCGHVNLYIRYDDLAGRVGRVFDYTTSLLSDRLFNVLPVKERRNFLPQHREYIAIERWGFLERMAASRGVNCEVYAHRFDNSPATGTFKDLAGHLCGSVYGEYGVKDLVVASTGNIAVAMSRYCAESGINLTAVLPKGTSRLNVSEISCYGQKAIVVDGDYSCAKRAAADLSARHGIFLCPNGWDPIRVEAKKTIAYEWIEKLGFLPDAYVQALSGGMGPLGIVKGIEELNHTGWATGWPRLILTQSDKCNPMALSWQRAKANGFPAGWQNEYETITQPATEVTTISTGEPKLYPYLAPIVKTSNGEIDDISEESLHSVSRAIAESAFVRVGPASAVAVAGFIRAVGKGDINNGDRVVVAIGEGARRAPGFFEKLVEESYMTYDEAVLLEKSDLHPSKVPLESLHELVLGGNAR